jgi:hypothetical protein
MSLPASRQASAVSSGRLTASAACLHAVVPTFGGTLWKEKGGGYPEPVEGGALVLPARSPCFDGRRVIGEDRGILGQPD